MTTQFFYASGLNADPGFLAISRGQLEGFRPVIRSGFNPDVDAGAVQSVWDQGALYVFPPSPSVMGVSSTSPSDAAAGTGARTLTVSGLDADYNPISELVTLNGQNQVSTVQQFLRVFGLSAQSAGSGGVNVGDIYCGTGAPVAGVPPTIYSRMRPGFNLSQGVQYTIPAGFTGYVINALASAMTSGTNQSTIVSIRRRVLGGVFNRTYSLVIAGQIADASGQLYVRYPEKTDIDVSVETTDNNIIVGAQLRLLLVPGVDNPA